MRKALLVVIALAIANLTTAFTAANLVPGTRVGGAAQASDANAMKPTECDSLNLTAIVTGGSGGGSAELVIGTSGNETLTGGGGDDCIVGGAGDDALSGGTGNDICIGGPGSDGYDATCETTVDNIPPIQFVKTVGSGTCGGVSHTITVPASGVAAGNTLIVRVGLRGTSAAAVAASDSRGNSYVIDRDVLNAGGARTVILSARVTTALVSGNTITVTHPNSAAESVLVAEFSGITAVNRVDVTGGATGSSATPSASLTTTNASNLLYGAVASTGLQTYTEASGWTTSTHVQMNCGGGASRGENHGAYRIVSSAAGYTYNPTISGTSTWAEAVVAYKAG